MVATLSTTAEQAIGTATENARLTISEAATELGILPDSLRQAVRREAIRAELVAGTWSIGLDELERYRRKREAGRGRPRRATGPFPLPGTGPLPRQTRATLRRLWGRSH